VKVEEDAVDHRILEQIGGCQLDRPPGSVLAPEFAGHHFGLRDRDHDRDKIAANTLGIVGMDKVHGERGDLLFRLPAEPFLDVRTDVLYYPFTVEDRDHVVDIRNEGIQFYFACRYFPVGLEKLERHLDGRVQNRHARVFNHIPVRRDFFGFFDNDAFGMT